MVTHTTILSAIISLGLLVAPTAGARLGGIDMNRACRDEYGSYFSADRKGNNDSCNDWFCRNNLSGEGNQGGGINTPRACVSQYGSGAYAVCNGGVFDWSCYR